MTRFQFDFEFCPGGIHSGDGVVASIGATLDSLDRHRPLVICGPTVGSTPEVIEPVQAGIGDRPIELFAETSAAKYLSTAVDGAYRAQEHDADVIVGVGGGSSLDLARAVSALLSHDAPIAQVAERTIEAGEVSVSKAKDPIPLLMVPTTLAGADLSGVGSVALTLEPGSEPDGEIPTGGLRDSRLLPAAAFFDAELYRTTPRDVLTASAMNGFNKGLEGLYSPNSNPITEATAMRGLGLLREHISALRETPGNRAAFRKVLAGYVLAQYGVSHPDSYKISVIHAFGHGFRRTVDAHQGTVHGIMTPYVLEYVFDNVDGCRNLIAKSLEIPTDGRDGQAVAADIVDVIRGVRDDLNLPHRLSDLEGLSRTDFPTIADAILDDQLLDLAPEGLDPSRDDVMTVLVNAW